MGIRIGPPGILIAIEGIDGAGKTTQAELIASRMEEAGLDVVRSKEPTSGPWGRKLRESASNGRMTATDELAAFIADRKEHVASTIGPALARGAVVIVDRYYFSNVAYQGARGMDPAEILRINEEFAPPPDMLIVLSVAPSVGVRRIVDRGDAGNLFEREEDLAASAAIFDQIDKPYLLRVDGTRAREEIAQAILFRLYDGALFRKACLKSHYKDTCEPAFCSFRISGECNYVKLGGLAPPLASITADLSMSPTEQVAAIRALVTGPGRNVFE